MYLTINREEAVDLISELVRMLENGYIMEMNFSLAKSSHEEDVYYICDREAH